MSQVIRANLTLKSTLQSFDDGLFQQKFLGQLNWSVLHVKIVLFCCSFPLFVCFFFTCMHLHQNGLSLNWEFTFSLKAPEKQKIGKRFPGRISLVKIHPAEQNWNYWVYSICARCDKRCIGIFSLMDNNLKPFSQINHLA